MALSFIFDYVDRLRRLHAQKIKRQRGNETGSVSPLHTGDENAFAGLDTLCHDTSSTQRPQKLFLGWRGIRTIIVRSVNDLNTGKVMHFRLELRRT